MDGVLKILNLFLMMMEVFIYQGVDINFLVKKCPSSKNGFKQLSDLILMLPQMLKNKSLLIHLYNILNLLNQLKAM
jgi:predicted MPP superfamily phosphohydrolase